MALTRKMLKAMGIEEEKIDQIIEAHAETTDALKAERDEANAKAQENAEAAKELKELRENPGDDFKAKYETEKQAFAEFKKQTEQQASINEKKALFRAQLEDMGITGKRASQIVKATDLSALTVKNGAFDDADAVKKSIEDEWGEFVPKTKTEGAKVSTPPTNTGASVTKEQFSKMSYSEKAELYQNDYDTYQKLKQEE